MKENPNLESFISFTIVTRKGTERHVKARADSAPVVFVQYGDRILDEVRQWTEDEHGKRMYSHSPVSLPQRK